MPGKEVEIVIEARVRIPGEKVVAYGPVRTAACDMDAPTHTAGFASVRFAGQLYWLAGNQRLVVAHLWEAWQAGLPFVSAVAILDAIDKPGGRLRDVFKDSDAWGGLVVDARSVGGPTGAYCVAWANAA